VTDPFVCVPLEIVRTNLSSGAFKLLVALLSFHNQKTGKCCPRVETICERLGGAPTRSVFRWLRELRRAGILEVTRHGRENTYTFNICQKWHIRYAKSGTSDMPKVAHQGGGHPYMNRCSEQMERTEALRASGLPVCDAAASSPKTKPQPAVPRKPIRKSVLDIFYERYATDEERKARPKS